MPFGMELRLGPGDFALDGDTVPPPKKKQRRGTAPNFWLMSIVAKQLDASRCHLVRR